MSNLVVNALQKLSGTAISILDDVVFATKNVSGINVLNATKIIAQNSTAQLAGLMRPTDKAKLDGIESQADKTDAVNVQAAGAIMHTDFSGASGILEKVSSGV